MRSNQEYKYRDRNHMSVSVHYLEQKQFMNVQPESMEVVGLRLAEKGSQPSQGPKGPFGQWSALQIGARALVFCSCLLLPAFGGPDNLHPDNLHQIIRHDRNVPRHDDMTVVDSL